jgi:hypothetical protein
MATEPDLSRPTEHEALESAEPTRQADGGPQQGTTPAPSRPGPDGDIVLDIPQLAVDELNLEIHAPILEQVKLEAKGLQVGLFAKIGLDNVARMVGNGEARRPPDIEGSASTGGGERPAVDDEQASERAADLRQELQNLVESAKEAYEEVSDRDMEQQAREFYDRARHAYARITGDAENGDEPRDDGRSGGAPQAGRQRRAESAGRRALEITKQGGKAAGLTAAGVAGGAALESVRHSGGVKLHLPLHRRSSSMPKALIDKVRDRIG